jgi:hypothetical protein
MLSGFAIHSIFLFWHLCNYRSPADKLRIDSRLCSSKPFTTRDINNQ